ncbi:tRNA-specific adenosine deaminase 2 [Ceratocystis pirilliformis]|uniref:tRNA-specific adenosine deaminase 2 n=1 Tax=Ceratocystis pirilliformis TaxID=259994 RepID=A0ABR3Z9Q6_9PEZI
MPISNGPALPVEDTPEFGFYVFQASLGSPLEFHPAQGTALLKEMIDVYGPGNTSIEEKTSSVQYPQLGLHGFFFRLTTAAHLELSFNPGQDCYCENTKAPNSWHEDLTKDGVDVTNSASRGSKTREQRSHAHMMRIVGACESCQRKKVRCDPKHRSSTSAAAINAITGSQAASSQSRKSLARKKAAAAKAAQKEAQASSQLSQSAQTVVPGVFEPSQPNIDDPISFLDAEFNNFDDIMNWGESAIPPKVLQDYEIFDKNLLSPNIDSSAGSPGVAFRPPSNPIALSGSNADTVVTTAANNRSDSLPTTQKTNTAYDSSNAFLSTATEYADLCLYSPSNSFSDEDGLAGPDTLLHKSSSQNGRHSHYSQHRGIRSAQETLVPPNILTVVPADIFHQASLSSVDSQLVSISPTGSTNASDVQVYHHIIVDDKVTETGSSSSVVVTASNSQHTLSSSEAPDTWASELSARCNPELYG